MVFAPALILLTLLSNPAFGNRSLPPINHTGAPGHQSCARCHTSSGNGNVALTFSGGAEFEPGQVYSLMVAITDPNKRRFGFSMVARNADSNRVDVGTWTAGSGTRAHGPGNSHISAAPAAQANSSHTFTMNWTAPASGVDNVTFYVSANAANGNGSSGGGDNVYLQQLTVSRPVAPNQPPSLTVPDGVLSIASGVETPIQGLTLDDPDAGDGNLTLTLAVQSGLLTANGSIPGGVGPDGITDNGSPSVTLDGTLAQLNATVGDLAGIIYLSNPEFTGDETLQLALNDNGNTGAVPEIAEATIMITVDPPPMPAVPPSLSDLLSMGAEGFQFTLNGVAGLSYIVEHTTDFENWDLLEEVTLAEGSAPIIDVGAANAPFRYYRAREAAQ